MKPITFGQHAPLRIAERHIRLDWVEKTVREPSWSESEPDDSTVERRFRAIPEHGDRVLRVAIRETKVAIHVISLHFDRRATRRHARQHLRP